LLLLIVLSPWRPILRQKELPLRRSLFRGAARAAARSRVSKE
jgi:hypothetical protein